MSVFQDLLEYCKIKAIKDSLLPDEETIWKSLCRSYSEKFHTPLHYVETMDPEKVIQTIFDSQHDKTDVFENIENILDTIYSIEDPEYKKKKEENLDAFVKIAETMEQQRMNRPKKTLFEKEPAKTENKLSGGSVDFSNLKEDR